MYSWWWVGLSPETCRVKAFAKNKPQFVASRWNYFHYKNTMHGTTNIKFSFSLFRNGGRLKLLSPLLRSNYTGDRYTPSRPWAGFSIDQILDSNYGNRGLNSYFSRRIHMWHFQTTREYFLPNDIFPIFKTAFPLYSTLYKFTFEISSLNEVDIKPHSWF